MRPGTGEATACCGAAGFAAVAGFFAAAFLGAAALTVFGAAGFRGIRFLQNTCSKEIMRCVIWAI
jgi:hypothetical protein